MTLEQLNIICQGTLMEHLGIEFVEISEEKIVAKMPVDKRTFQPAGRLHGGASAALAESVGSAGSLTLIDNEKYSVLGIDLNATHLAATHQTEVFGIGKIIYRGKTQHVWEIKIEDKTGKLISICRLTNRIIPKSIKN
jgi:uncharacterized domain 1